ncbi:unnamed protein product, partial [Mesorhabditis spiculigera]
MCNDKTAQLIGPCRPVCEAVRGSCLQYLRDFGFDWPPNMNCSLLPKVNNAETMCMPGPGTQWASTEPPEEETQKPTQPVPLTIPGSSNECSPGHFYFNRTGVCVPLCNLNHGLAQTDRHSATTYLAALCGLSVLFTFSSILFFLFRPHVLPTFPEKSLLWSATAFMFSSIIYVFSMLYREEVSCTLYAGQVLSVVSALPHVPCTAVAAALFYLGTAGRLWWFVMCLAWKEHTLQTASIDKYRRQVVLVTWALPLAVVMLALMARSIQADPLAGVCLVGAASQVLEGVFPVFRECVLFLVVFVPLCAGCCSLVGYL